jgi:hypothetical protein
MELIDGVLRARRSKVGARNRSGEWRLSSGSFYKVEEGEGRRRRVKKQPTV